MSLPTDRSAARIPLVGGVVDGALLEHVIVRGDRVVVGQLDAVLAKNLAVRKLRVSSDASVGKRSSRVEQVHDVDVHGGELGRLNLEITEDSSGLVHGGNIGGADPVVAVAGLETGVLPEVDLSHSHDVGDAHGLLSCKHGDLTNSLSFDSETLVKSLGEEVESKLGVNIFNELEHDRNEFASKNRRPVVVSGVNPTVEEVVVAVGKALSFIEEVVGFLLIEFGAGIVVKAVPSDMEVSVLGVLNPVSPLGALETVSGPVPSILRLDNVKLTIEAEGHDVVTNARASAVHDHWVETVKAHDSEEVTGLNEIRIDINNLSFTLLKLDTESLLDELNVGLFHVRWNVRANDRDMGVIRDATNKCLHGVEERLNVLDDILAESKCLDASIADISLGLRRVHLESEAVLSVEVKNLEVLNFSIGKQDNILAHLGTRVFCSHMHVESIGVVDFLVLEGDRLEAAALISSFGVLLADLGGEHWQEHAKVIRGLIRSAGLASRHRSFAVGNLCRLELVVVESMAEEGLLLGVVSVERKKRGSNGLLDQRLVSVDILIDDTAKFVFGDLVGEVVHGVSIRLEQSCNTLTLNGGGPLDLLLSAGDGGKGQKTGNERTHFKIYKITIK